MKLFGLMVVKEKEFAGLIEGKLKADAEVLDLITKVKDMTANADACKSNLHMMQEDNNVLKSKLVKANQQASEAKGKLALLQSEIEDTKTSVKKPGMGQAALLTDAPTKPKPAKRKPSPKKRGGKK